MAIAMRMERVSAFRRTKLYDLFAAAPFIAWSALCIVHMLPSLADQVALVRLFIRTDSSALPTTLVLSTVSHLGTLAFLVMLVVMFTVRYIAQAASPELYPRFAALAGTYLSTGFVLLPQQELSGALYLVSLLSIIAGTGFAIWAVLFLGRSISLLPEARRLVTRGPYALIRHPLYIGELIALAGVALQYHSVWALLLLGLVFAFQLQRMKYEELVLLQFFPEYQDYMARTARLVPGVY